MRYLQRAGVAFLALAIATSPASAQETTYTLYGTPGLVEMPTARSAPDGEIIASYSHWRLQQKTSLTFQVTPRITGTFRYSGIDERSGPGTDGTFDRSFDLRYRIVDEGQYRPAIAIGVQDFLGTGLLSSEYVVATKAVTNSLDVTAGIGWGRFGTRNGFSNPLGGSFETRPELDFGEGGEISSNQFFRGDAAVFGGVDYRVSEKLSFQIEYSSDEYRRESGNGSFDGQSPFNVGMIYRPYSNLALNLAYLQGSELAGAVTVAINPNKRPVASGLEAGPIPLNATSMNRDVVSSWSGGISSNSDVSRTLAQQGITLNAYNVSSDTAYVQYTNNRYRSEAQAMGRAARVLDNYLPDAISTIVLQPLQQGIPVSSISFSRAELSRQEIRADGAAALLNNSQIGDAVDSGNFETIDSDRSPFSWGVLPYVQLLLFNGNAPVQADFGIKLDAEYKIRPNLVLATTIDQSLQGRRTPADSDPVAGNYPIVRTDSAFFGTEGTPVVSKLTLTHFGRPGSDLYSRTTVGYLERQYGGVSTELLWKPVESKLALGAELNYVAKRERDLLFGFQDFNTVTGHVSAYYDFENGFLGQVDVGRYLAGDWGATVGLDREFENGWKVGAYFTLTDMPFEEFGEGSFDKGIRVSIPLDYFLGTSSRQAASTNLNSLARDGGSRVNVDGRLYETVRRGHIAGPMGDTWGRFWR